MKVIRQREIFAVGACLVPALVVLAFLSYQDLYDPSIFTRDPMAVASILSQRDNIYGVACCKSYFGAVSTLGIIMWSGVAVLCFTMAVHLRRRAETWFYAVAFVLTTFLALDDAFMLHEHFDGAGILIKLLLHAFRGFLVFALLACLWMMGGSRYTLLLLASLGFFVASILIDTVETTTWHMFVEDSLKFIGIALWLSFFVAHTLRFLSEQLERAVRR